MHAKQYRFMKKTLFFLFSLLFLHMLAIAQTTAARKMGNSGGAARTEELGRAVFNALQTNRPGELNNYFPQAGDLRLLKRKSSPDMRAVLDQNTPETIRQNLTNDFNQVVQEATASTVNLSEWQLSHTKASQVDRKNRNLFRVALTLTDRSGAEKTILFEAFRVRSRYFLFRQMLLKPAA